MNKPMGWTEMASITASRLAVMEANDTGTMQERFSIRHMRLYIAVCQRLGRCPELSEDAQMALADRFLQAGNGLAKRYGTAF